jgi:hypothetical protein
MGEGRRTLLETWAELWKYAVTGALTAFPAPAPLSPQRREALAQGIFPLKLSFAYPQLSPAR